MYPIIPRLLLGFLVFGEIYFIILLNHGVTKFNIGIQEAVCGFTVFSFLCWLRIADDFKDYELDCRLLKDSAFRTYGCLATAFSASSAAMRPKTMFPATALPP